MIPHMSGSLSGRFDMNYDKFFIGLSKEASNSKKIALLMDARNDTLLKEIVRLALDPFTNFYIRKIPEYTSSFGTMNLDDALNSLDMLSNRTYTGNAGIDWLKNTLQHTLPEDAKVIERIINRDLGCGVSTATANKVWPGLISKYPVMLCSPYSEKLVDSIKFPAIAQRKEDGMRFNAFVLDGNVTLFSRSGKLIDLLGNLDASFKAMSCGSPIVYDGELLVEDINGNILDRKTGNGILNKAVKGTISEEESSRVVAVLWDSIDAASFRDGLCTMPYSKRLYNLIYDISLSLTKKIRLVETFNVNSLEEIQDRFKEQLAMGYEGIILKDPTSIWESKRSNRQVKFKAELDCDLRCVGIEEGQDKYTGMIGALVCQSKDAIISVSVGSGLTDEMRSQDPSFFLNKIIAVKYNARIENKMGKKTLYQPIFLEVRLDKNEADSSKAIA